MKKVAIIFLILLCIALILDRVQSDKDTITTGFNNGVCFTGCKIEKEDTIQYYEETMEYWDSKQEEYDCEKYNWEEMWTQSQCEELRK